MGALLPGVQAQAGRGRQLTAEPQQSATSTRWLRLWPWPAVAAIFLVLADQGTKEWARAAIPRHTKIEVIPGFFDLVHVYNKGAAWGMLSDHTFVLGLISATVFAWLLWKFAVITEGWPERGVAVTLLLGGVVGNLIDRFWRSDGVFDFLSFHLGSYEWPAFNVADSAICIGVGLFIVSSFIRPAPEKIEAESAVESSTEPTAQG